MGQEEKDKIRNERRFNYDLGESCGCMIDEDVLTDEEKDKYKDCIGKLGVITHTFWYCHVFGRGYVYHHKIEFNGVLFDEYIVTELLKDLKCISLEYLQKTDENITKEKIESLGLSVCLIK